MSTETASDDDNFGTEHSHKVCRFLNQKIIKNIVFILDTNFILIDIHFKNLI